MVLLRNLPRESRYIAERVGARSHWGETEHLLADLVDLTQLSMWQFASAHSKKRPKRPKPISRPGVERADRKRFGNARMTVAQARAYLDRFKTKGGARGS